MEPKKIIKQSSEWQLYEQGLDGWTMRLDFPHDSLVATDNGFSLVIPADIWSILRSGTHSKAPYYRMNSLQLRNLADSWVSQRLSAWDAAKTDEEAHSIFLDGCLVANLEDSKSKQVEDFISFYTPPNVAALSNDPDEETEEDPDLVYSLYPYLESDDEVVGDMKRGAHCYFCGTNLTRMVGDPLGACYECDKCPPVTHWRWNEDTEFLQLYVAGERCPYCDLQVPQSTEVASNLKELTRVEPAVTESVPLTSKSTRKTGKPVTVNGVWWGSVVEWCRSHNDHDARGGYSYHNCSKELARMQAKGESDVVWHNRDRIPGTKELISSAIA